MENRNNSGQKPSRLMQLKSNYHDKIMREKEEKLIRMYEDNQKKALNRTTDLLIWDLLFNRLSAK
jgi:hypothetical protein